MSRELELLREFRAEDANVDAATAQAARSRLLAHIADAGRDQAAGGGAARPPSGLRRIVGLSSGAIAVGLAVGVVIVVVAVLLSVSGRPASLIAPRPAISHGSRPLFLPNLAPASPPRLAGQEFCDADLSPPGAVPGLGGSRSGVIQVNAATIRGVNQSPFSIVARGLVPSARVGDYAVWITQVDGLGSEAVPVPGAKPRLLTVVDPGVGRTGKVAVEGVIPSDITGTYLIRLTLQPHSEVTTPGRTVLEGVGPL